MTEQEFWGHAQTVYNQVAETIAVFHTYEEINRLGKDEEAVFRTLNNHAKFWNVMMLSLQTTLFVAVSRIFDENANTLSIHRLVKETMAHPEFFSKDALRKRKSALKIEPEYIDALIDEAWAPTSGSELRYLKKALAPHAKKFAEIYRPIRHSYFAHLLLEPVSELFSRTNRAELGKILDFLHELVDGIEHLYLNGLQPELKGRDFSHSNGKIRASVRMVMGKMVGVECLATQ